MTHSFKHGDKVRGTRSGLEYTVEFGPYPDTIGEQTYLVTNSEGRGVPLAARLIKPIPPADPRADVVAKALPEAFDDLGWSYDDMETEAVARTVLAALDATEPAKPAPLAVGDKIRILVDGWNYADVDTGDVLTVTELLRGGEFSTNAPGVDDHDHWFFDLADEGTGWERVTEPARIRFEDNMGDVWEQQSDGTFTQVQNDDGSAPDATRRSWAHGYTLVRLNESFGPLIPLQ